MDHSIIYPQMPLIREIEAFSRRMNFQILLGFGKEAKQAIVDQLPQLAAWA